MSTPDLFPHAGPTTLLAAALTLVSWWKPLVLLLPVIPWAWLVSHIFDKHAARFYMPREKWNVGHLAVGTIAVLAAFLMPVPGDAGFWAGLGAMIVILGADIGVFVYVANHDDNVPEQHRLTLDFSKYTEARQAKAAAKKQGKVELVVKQPDKVTVAPPANDAPDFEVRVAAEALVIRALDSRASQVELGPTGAKDGAYGAVMIIDGVAQRGDSMPPANAAKIIDFWKGAAKLDLNDRRKKQQDDCSIERNSKPTKLRVSSIGSAAGQKLTLLFNPEQAVRRKPEDLGLLESQLSELRTITSTTEGVVLLGGQPDGGRTTTLYSVVKLHDAYTQNIQTVELEPQDALEGIRQNKWDPQAEGPDFSTLTRSILRRDPDIVALAELPDQATAKEIVRADHSRTRCYIALRADNALQTLVTWVKIVGEPGPAADCLRGVVAHRLIRKLCTNCRVPYVPSPDMLKKLGLPADKVKQLFKKGGQVIIKKDPETCPVCQGLGYVGLDGLYEVYAIGEAERELIKAGNINGLKAELRKKQLPTIAQVALRKAVDGTTSVEEVGRVTAEGQPPAAAGGAKPPGGRPPAAPGAPGQGAPSGGKPAPSAPAPGGKPPAPSPKAAASGPKAPTAG